ncbi:MAG: PDZ domain-containing protein [Pirellulaceae bacterium]
MTPATDQTWRNQKVLHRWFAASSLLLLVATIWMLADDHHRQWKAIQRVANGIEIKMTTWRQRQLQSQRHLALQQTLEDRVRETRCQPLDAEPLAQFRNEVHSDAATRDFSFDAMDGLVQQLDRAAGSDAAAGIRDRILAALSAIVRKARSREDELLRQQKSAAGKRDAAIAQRGLLIRDRRESEQAEQQTRIDRWKVELGKRTSQYERAKTHRERLDLLLKQMTVKETRAVADLNESRAELEKLQAAVRERQSTYITWYGVIPLPGKRVLELPIFDAFNSPRKIENLWSEGLEIDYGHRKVRRFDRCTTCHQATDKTLPGTADQPELECAHEVTLILDPSSKGEETVAEESQEGETTVVPSDEDRLEHVWGIQLAEEGLLADEDITVCYVRPRSPAALAETVDPASRQGSIEGRRLRESLLQSNEMQTSPVAHRRGILVGDVIVSVDGTSIGSVDELSARLRAAGDAGTEVALAVHRGLPPPYSSHPRLDLYVGSLSPHRQSVFACSVCHEGQGSATAFKWASHSPNSEKRRREWEQRYGWFDNPHWMYPMHPQRFAESSCLKCHHDVAQLRPSERFPEPPAPKLLRGYQLIRTYGCFGCHEINGSAAGRRIGPDMRLEPNWHAAAMQLKNDPGLQSWTESQKSWVEQLIQHPDRDGVRRRILELLSADAVSRDPQFSYDTQANVTPLFKEMDTPGTFRKRGPSLRFIAQKVEREFLVDFIRQPRHFRPSSRMPQFFGLWKHLEKEGRAVAERFEPIEVLAMATYLQKRSQDYTFLAPPDGMSASSREEKVARGKVLFQQRGCLACHTHEDFSDADAFRDPEDIVQGPDLTGLAPKFSHAPGRKWLYSWIQQPTRYHPRTLMPETFLEPIQHEDGTQTDPAEDIVEYLLASPPSDWAPVSDVPLDTKDWNSEQRKALDDLALDGLRDAFSLARSAEFAEKGIPAAYRAELKGAEVELLRPEDVRAEGFQLPAEQKLMYVGRKAIARRGCYGCHDIPGMEAARSIGPALSDWGRKKETQLAFESVVPYLERTDGDGEDEVPSFYMHQILSGHRAGFIYQKLREPRGYDYRRTESKRYGEWLRMPQFSFTREEREAIITWVLGLVADPPSERYVCKPDPRREAIIAGEKLLDQYRCNACHWMEPQQWRLLFEPGEFGSPPRSESETFPFLTEHLRPQQLDGSAGEDESGFLHATLRGMPALDEDGLPLVVYDYIPIEDDEEFDPDDEAFDPEYMDYGFQLWQTAALEGERFDVGMKPSAIDATGVRLSTIVARRPARGGFLAKYLLPHVVEREKRLNPNANGAEAWGWLPPSLYGQGTKVQSDWLHDFLLSPYRIRPSVVMRMPRYNLSPKEATELVRYFAAVDNADYPYEYQGRRQAEHLAVAEQHYQDVLGEVSQPGKLLSGGRLDHAMRILTDSNYCIKCHIVGDFVPQTSDKAKAPDLALVYRRLRPENVRRWIARPTSILPYTGMPVNISYDANAAHLGGVSQDLYHGTSLEQLDAIVDLLMNFDAYAKQRSSMARLVQERSNAAPTDDETEGR